MWEGLVDVGGAEGCRRSWWMWEGLRDVGGAEGCG